MNPSPWAQLSSLIDVELPRADWERHFTGDLQHAMMFLTRCDGRIAETIPCPESGHRLHVARRGRRYIAYPSEGFENDASEIHDIPEKSVLLHRIHRDTLEMEIAKALGFAPLPVLAATTSPFRVVATAGTGVARKPVLIAHARNSGHAIDLCAAMVKQNPSKCVLVLPFFDQHCIDYVRRCEHELVILDETVALTPGGIVSKGVQSSDVVSLLEVKVIDDYAVLRLPNGKEITLAPKYKCRAFVRYIHQRRLQTGERDFYYDEQRKMFNASQERFTISSEEFKYDLFKGLTQHFDVLFKTLDPASEKYRINF